MRIGVCPGSFDPITNGHLDIIQRSAYIYDKVIIGVAKNPTKKTLFSLDERMVMVNDSVGKLDEVETKSFTGLLVDFATDQQASVIIKGLRAVSDFEHEFQMAHLNKKLSSKIETVFLMASHDCMFLRSSAVKEIAMYGGSVNGLVSELVEKMLRDKLSGKSQLA